MNGKLGSGTYSKVLSVGGKAVKYHDNVHNIALREWLVSQSISHPNVMKFDSIDSDFNITMKECDYDLYTAICDEVYTIDELYDIMKQVLCGLDAFHYRKFAHNDIKARNIVIKDNVPKIIDFGLSIPYNLLYTRKTIQTITHRAPEIFGIYCVIDDSADVWAFGCLLFECIYRAPVVPEETWKFSSPQAIVSLVDPSYRNTKAAYIHLMTPGVQEKFNDYLINYKPVNDNNTKHVIYDIMKDCLLLDRKKRPTIRQLMEKYDIRQPVNYLPAISPMCNVGVKQVLSKHIDSQFDGYNIYCKKIAFEIGKTLHIISNGLFISEIAHQAVILSKCILNYELNVDEVEVLRKLNQVINKLYI